MMPPDKALYKTPAKSDWIVMLTADDVALQARDIIMQAANKAIEDRGIFKIVLAGGTTPEKVYRLLAEESIGTQACDWKRWHLYLGDERCLSIDDPQRNSQMVKRTLLDKVDIPNGNVHFIAAELGAKEAARRYQKTIEQALPFDMVILGMGEDGHTASLFPGHRHRTDELVHAIHDAPKPPPDRVSLSVRALSENKNLLIIVTGSSKRESVEKWYEGEDLPIAAISTLGTVNILLDHEAGSRNA